MLSCPAPVSRARTVEEACRLRAEQPDATVLAGGTDVMVYLEGGSLAPTRVIDLWGCEGLRGISADGRTIGTLTTWTDVARHPALPGALRECALTVGAAQIQNRGTVGGNIVNASPAGDSLPLWLVLDAAFVLASVRGERRVKAEHFWLAYRRTALAADELLVRVELPPTEGEVRYRKVGTRLAQSISKVVLATRLVRDGARVTDARVAFGSVAPVPVRARHVERALVGRGLDPAAAREVDRDVHPIDDVRSTADYRRRVTRNLLRGWIEAEAGRG